MTEPLLRRNSVLGAEIEAVSGTPETIQAADLLLVYDVSPDFSIETLNRQFLRSSLGQNPPLAGFREAVLDFSTELLPSGTAGTAPEVGDLLRACGFSVATKAASHVVYTPRNSSLESATLKLYQDEISHRLQGARGNLEMVLEAGQIGRMNWHFEGIDFSYDDESNIAGTAYTTAYPPVVMGCTFTLGGYEAVIPGLTINMQNELTRSRDVSPSHGTRRIMLTARNPIASCSPEAVTRATHDFFDEWDSTTKLWLRIVVGTVAGRICEINCPRVYITDMGFSDRDGIIANDIELMLCEILNVPTSFTLGAGSNTTTLVSASFTTNDEYNGALVTMLTGDEAGETAIITDTVAGSTSITVSPALSGSPSLGETFSISDKDIHIMYR